MSHKRKIEDAQRRVKRLRADEDEALCRFNQTGRASDRHLYIVAMAEAGEAEAELAQIVEEFGMDGVSADNEDEEATT